MKKRYKYDPHVHTQEVSGCGKISAKNIVGLYKELGYQGIIITDHYYKKYFTKDPTYSWEEKIDIYLKGYKEAFREGKKIGLDVFLGLEIKFNDQPEDYLVYGIDEEFLKENQKLFNFTLAEFYNYIKNKEIYIFQAHPFRAGLTVANPNYLDGIEIYNGNPRHNSKNKLAEKYAKDNNLLTISSSDTHQVEDVGRGGIISPIKLNSTLEMIQLLEQSQDLKYIFT